jgi:transposase
MFWSLLSLTPLEERLPGRTSSDLAWLMRGLGCCDHCSSASVRSDLVRIGLETGPLTTWLWTALTAEGLPTINLNARHAKKALDMKVNKTDANDAEGLAHLVRAGWYREVRVKSRRAMLAKALLGARRQLLGMSLALENQIRGILKTFGRIVPKGAGGVFDALPPTDRLALILAAPSGML